MIVKYSKGDCKGEGKWGGHTFGIFDQSTFYPKSVDFYPRASIKGTFFFGGRH